MNTNRIIFYSLLLFLLTQACDKNEIEDFDLDFGYDYFPLEIGNTWIYEADSIIYDPIANGTQIDTIQFFIRETITDTFRNAENELSYRIQYETSSSGEDWSIQYVFSSQLETTRVIRNENNLSFIKLVFPIEIGQSWNGNAFIDESIKIEVAGEPIEIFKGWDASTLQQQIALFNIDGENYEDVIEVTVANSENLVESRQVKEYYAKNMGLVYQEFRIFDTQCQVCCNRDLALCNGLPWEEKAEKGFIFRRKLLSFQ